MRGRNEVDERIARNQRRGRVNGGPAEGRYESCKVTRSGSGIRDYRDRLVVDGYTWSHQQRSRGFRNDEERQTI